MKIAKISRTHCDEPNERLGEKIEATERRTTAGEKLCEMWAIKKQLLKCPP